VTLGGPGPVPVVPERRWSPVFLVLLVIVVVLGGGLVAAGSVAGDDGGVIPGGGGGLGSPVEVAPGVSVPVASGWSREEPPSGIAARFTRGSAILDVFVFQEAATETDLYRSYVDQVLRAGATSLQAGEPQQIQLDAGTPAARGGYLGTFEGVASPIEGELTAVLTSDGRGVVFDGWAGQGQLAPVLEEIRAMVDGSAVA
jgi:hypothetical protein